MSTAEAVHRSPLGHDPRVDATSGARLGAAVRSLGISGAFGVALLVLAAYAAFAHGAVGSPTEPRLQVLTAAIAAAGAACWIWSGTLRFSAPRIALAGTVLLGAFAIWTGVTLVWSVAPDQTWIELNRVITYLIVLGLSIAVGASFRRSIALLATGFLIVALAVVVYALGQKLLPGLHISGVFNLNQTGSVPRLQEPLGYWNALALFLVLAVPVALSRTIEAGATKRIRLATLLLLELLLLTVGFTYSRGGVLAMVVALIVWFAYSGMGLRALMWLGVACLATAAPLAFGLTSHALSATGVSLSRREVAGGELAAVTLASLLVLFAGGRKLLELEQTVQPDPGRVSMIKRFLIGALAAALVVVVVVVSVSGRGLTGTVSHAWHTFTATRATSASDPHRLLSADSENRWVWWKEATGAFGDRPVGGWGAGSFPVVHLLYRRDTLTVQQPHSVPLQLLAEDGLIGAVLALGAYGLLLTAGVGTVKRRPPGAERALAAALLAGAVAYGFHSLYDWDWDIPGVTLPALIFLGVLAGARPTRTVQRDGPLRVPGPGAGPRLVALGTSAVMLSLFVVSAVLPSLSTSEASSAVVAGSSSSTSELAHAQASAQLSTHLDPLSDAGLLAGATIAVHEGRLAQAHNDLLAAIRRQPTDVQAWEQLVAFEILTGNSSAARAAAQRMIMLDPEGKAAQALVGRLHLLAAPPSGSATAVPTALG